MRILIEEYQYDYEDVRDVLKGFGVLPNGDGKLSLSYVGYYFNDDPDVNDCVFYFLRCFWKVHLAKRRCLDTLNQRI